MAEIRAHADTAIAIEALSAVIAESPNRSELYLRRAEHHAEHENWKAAESDILRAAALTPHMSEVSAAFGKIYLATGRLAAADEVLISALRRDPHQPELLVLRARVRAKMGAAQAAYEDYVTAIRELEAPRPELYLEGAGLAVSAELRLKLLDDGIARLGVLVVLVERAIELELQLGHIDAALARMNQLIDSMERKEIWLKRRGDLLSRYGRDDEARRSYAQALANIRALPHWLQAGPAMAALAGELRQLTDES